MPLNFNAFRGLVIPREDPFTPSDPDWPYILDPSRHENPLQLLQRYLENGGELSTLSRRHSDLPAAPCLYVAAYVGNTSAVKFLLDNQGVDVETRYHEPFVGFDKTALHAAAEQARCSVVRVLIARGANVRAVDKFGNSAIYFAARSGRKSILQLLVSAGASLSLDEVTKAYDISRERRLVDPFWFCVVHGKDKFPAPDKSLLGDGADPVWLQASMGRRWRDNPIVRDLETRLLGAAFPGQDPVHSSTTDPNHELCSNCLLWSLRQPDEFAACESRIAAWKDTDLSFTYGFIRRCEICRTELINHDILPRDLSETPLPLGKTAEERKFKDDDDLYCLLNRLETERPESEGSTVSYALGSYWLLRCLKSHKECTSVLKPLKLPRRVIDIRVGEDCGPVSLYEPGQGETGYYFALSYRWGKNVLKTLRRNLDQFKQAIPQDSLSQTVKDAITVTRTLGIPYLWIDALCIVQDSPEEWESEINTMDQVYTMALLTIAADVEVSDDDQLGFLRPEQPKGRGNSRPTGILDTRGWVLQEQVLSPRTLTFTDSGVYWTCACLNASTANPGGFIHLDHMREPQIRKLQRYLKGHDRTGRRWRAGMYEAWVLLVTEYSRRDLTVEGDRLNALMGIQAVFGKALDDQCLVGLWRENIAHQLLWWVSRDEELYSGNSPLRHGSAIYPFSRPSRPAYERPATFTAPTWSWASVRGPVTYTQAIDSISTYLWTPAFRSYEETEVEVHEVIVEASGPQAFRGSIRLTGSMMKASSFVNNTGRQSMIKAEAFCVSCTQHPDGGGSHGQVVEEPWYPDVLPAYEGEIFCLLLKDSHDQWSLCLVPTGNTPNEYERVGVCTWRAHGVNWWKNSNVFVNVAAPERRRKTALNPEEGKGPFLYPNAWTETLTIV